MYISIVHYQSYDIRIRGWFYETSGVRTELNNQYSWELTINSNAYTG